MSTNRTPTNNHTYTASIPYSSPLMRAMAASIRDLFCCWDMRSKFDCDVLSIPLFLIICYFVDSGTSAWRIVFLFNFLGLLWRWESFDCALFFVRDNHLFSPCACSVRAKSLSCLCFMLCSVHLGIPKGLLLDP